MLSHNFHPMWPVKAGKNKVMLRRYWPWGKKVIHWVPGTDKNFRFVAPQNHGFTLGDLHVPVHLHQLWVVIYREENGSINSTVVIKSCPYVRRLGFLNITNVWGCEIKRSFTIISCEVVNKFFIKASCLNNQAMFILTMAEVLKDSLTSSNFLKTRPAPQQCTCTSSSDLANSNRMSTPLPLNETSANVTALSDNRPEQLTAVVLRACCTVAEWPTMFLANPLLVQIQNWSNKTGHQALCK